MRAVEIAVFVDGLWLKPDAELHTEIMDLVGQLFQSTAQLFFIDDPVPESTDITVSFAEPSVVHDEELNAKISGILCHTQKFFPVKIKVDAFPAVQENGTPRGFVFTTAQVIAVRSVVVV